MTVFHFLVDHIEASRNQQHSFFFQSAHVTRVEINCHTLEGGNLTAQIGGKTISVVGNNTLNEYVVDAVANEIYITDNVGARNRLYQLKIYGLFDLPDLTPAEQAEPQIVARIGKGPSDVNAVNADIAQDSNNIQRGIDIMVAFFEEQSAFWEDVVATDPDNTDNLGTLGYLAASSADFFAQALQPQHINSALGQLTTWREYTASQAGKEFADMQPINIWFGEQ